jgi:hypothetical protein
MAINGFDFFLFAIEFALTNFSTRWFYDSFPDDEFVYVYSGYYLQYLYSTIVYPPEYSPQSPRDRENREKAIAHFQSLLTHLDLVYQSGEETAVISYFIKRVPNEQFQFRTMVYAGLPEPERLVGVTDSLPFWLRGIGQVGWPTFFRYPLWSYDSAGMDEEIQNAIFEIRDGLRPWTLGGYDVPLSNQGHPGLLEIHRQLTGSEDLGIYHQPVLRDMVGESSCPDTVFVRVTVTGTRIESGDLILPRGTSWPYNHYGQVRVRRLVDGVPYALTPWQWIRAREQVVPFHLPKKRPDADPGLVLDVAEYQAYGGLTVTATVLS